jgi:tRNA threonylcarbamoyladenosine biosynthesis protein TsaE
LTTPVTPPVTHWPILETRVLTWDDEPACAAFAQSLAAQPGITEAFITLHGPLGAGKTTFVRHLLRALGVQGRIKSPTYAVMEPHGLPGGGEAAHFDFYRFTDPREWEDAGFRDVFARPGLKIAEWPEQAASLLPVPDLDLVITPLDGDVREVTATAHTPRGAALLAPQPGRWPA